MRTKSIVLTATDNTIDPGEADIFDLVAESSMAYLMPALEIGKEIIIRVLPRRKMNTFVNDQNNASGFSIYPYSSAYDATNPHDDTRFQFASGWTWGSLVISPFAQVLTVGENDGVSAASINAHRAPAFVRLQWSGRDWMVIAASNAVARPEQLDHLIFGPTDPLRQAPEDGDFTREGEQQAEDASLTREGEQQAEDASLTREGEQQAEAQTEAQPS